MYSSHVGLDGGQCLLVGTVSGRAATPVPLPMVHVTLAEGLGSAGTGPSGTDALWVHGWRSADSERLLPLLLALLDRWSHTLQVLVLDVNGTEDVDVVKQLGPWLHLHRVPKNVVLAVPAGVRRFPTCL